jgi:hypothetical protein
MPPIITTTAPPPVHAPTTTGAAIASALPTTTSSSTATISTGAIVGRLAASLLAPWPWLVAMGALTAFVVKTPRLREGPAA